MATTIDNKETVILAHGLWMNAGVLLLQQYRFRRLGFAVRRVSYPSWRGSLADNVRLLSRRITETPAEMIHVVAHSLGGLITLQMLAAAPDPRLRRVVLMGTPCAGSHCAAVAMRTPGLRALVGRTYRDWNGLLRQEPGGNTEIGVIAGTHAIGLGRLIPGLAVPNDGLIAVEETRLAMARDRIELPVCHSGMLISRACVRQAARFLRSGAFAHG